MSVNVEFNLASNYTIFLYVSHFYVLFFIFMMQWDISRICSGCISYRKKADLET